MEPIDIYLMYCAMKAHFGKSDYDFIKYEGKSKVSRDSFWKRKDRSFFVKLSRKYKSKDEIKDYLVSNFVKENKGWVGNFTDENYIQWKNNNLIELFKKDISLLLKNFEDGKIIFVVPKNGHPKLLREYLGKRISIETMIILDEITNYTSNWNISLKDDVVWPNINYLMNNYKKFLTIDKKQCRIDLFKSIKKE